MSLETGLKAGAPKLAELEEKEEAVREKYHDSLSRKLTHRWANLQSRRTGGRHSGTGFHSGKRRICRREDS